MARRRRKKKTTVPKPLGNNRAAIVLQIVRSDNTFTLVTLRDGEQIWVGKCIHCNRRLTVLPTGQTDFTIEHIIPRWAGGDNDSKNLALACGECNHEKGRRHDEHVGKNGRADEVITSLQGKKEKRWRDPKTSSP